MQTKWVLKRTDMKPLNVSEENFLVKVSVVYIEVLSMIVVIEVLEMMVNVLMLQSGKTRCRIKNFGEFVAKIIDTSFGGV